MEETKVFSSLLVYFGLFPRGIEPSSFYEAALNWAFKKLLTNSLLSPTNLGVQCLPSLPISGLFHYPKFIFFVLQSSHQFHEFTPIFCFRIYYLTSSSQVICKAYFSYREKYACFSEFISSVSICTVFPRHWTLFQWQRHTVPFNSLAAQSHLLLIKCSPLPVEYHIVFQFSVSSLPS